MNTSKAAATALLLALLAGCGQDGSPSAQNGAPAHKHEHRPPHGGTAVELGEEAFHLELVRDAAEGSMTCYVMDGHLENFIRVAAPGFTVEAEVAGTKQALEFRAVPNTATGEKEGDTSQFDAKAGWLRTATNFSGRIPGLTIRGTTFTDIRFRFPEGNE